MSDALSMDPKTAAEIASVGRISAVPTILNVVCGVTGMGFAAVARVTDERWIACSVRDDIAFGLTPGDELKLESTICNEIRQHREPVVINHVAEDPAWRLHHTPLQYGFQSYISMPITLADGSFFGTLCAIDPRPAKLDTPEIIGMFQMFADLIAFHLDAQKRIDTSEARLSDAHATSERNRKSAAATQARLDSSEALLSDERETSALREQFIAVLGHDLRNPLAVIDAGMHLLGKSPLDAKATRVVGMVQSSVKRMAGLIDNLMDFARGRLGSGIGVSLAPIDAEPMLMQVINEMRAGHPDSTIETQLELSRPVQIDGARIGQLLSNLLANAVTHGATDQPIRVSAITRDAGFELSIANGGAPIDPTVMPKLFQPFFRGEARASQQGLGLGLYIASEIARAHGGELKAVSDATETRFTLVIPGA